MWIRGSSPLDHCSLPSQMWRAQEIDFTRAPKGCMCLKCVIIKITSSSIMVLPLKLGPSHQCEGIFAPGNCGGWLRLVPRAKRGWGVCSAGWLNLLSGRWAAQGPFFPLEAFSDACPIQLPIQWVLGLTAQLRSWSLRDCAASITVQAHWLDRYSCRGDTPSWRRRCWGRRRIREEERGLTHVYIIYQDLTVI